MLKSALRFIEPMECLMVSALPEGPDWSYEIKLDGYRARPFPMEQTRSCSPAMAKTLVSASLTVLAVLSRAIPSGSIVDGELVALDTSGKPSFSLVQNSGTSGASFVFFAFDLLQLAGTDLTRKPLVEEAVEGFDEMEAEAALSGEVASSILLP